MTPAISIPMTQDLDALAHRWRPARVSVQSLRLRDTRDAVVCPRVACSSSDGRRYTVHLESHRKPWSASPLQRNGRSGLEASCRRPPMTGIRINYSHHWSCPQPAKFGCTPSKVQDFPRQFSPRVCQRGLRFMSGGVQRSPQCARPPVRRLLWLAAKIAVAVKLINSPFTSSRRCFLAVFC